MTVPQALNHLFGHSNTMQPLSLDSDVNGTKKSPFLVIIVISVHGGRVANALACNAGGDGFATHVQQYF